GAAAQHSAPDPPGNGLSGAAMSADEQQRQTGGWPQRSGHGAACAFTGKHHCTDRVRARQRARPWAVHGPTERANVVVTTHRQPEAVFAIARIGG
ncbi:TPA: hypothetical protein HMT01_28290, partial [Escherichia coli]|nr:hypothetical protein [Escherichia coli]